MANDLLSILIILIALAINGFLIAAVYYSKHKSESKFGKIGIEIDKMIKKEIVDIKDLFKKKKS